jgi:hypothetical protein
MFDLSVAIVGELNNNITSFEDKLNQIFDKYTEESKESIDLLNSIVNSELPEIEIKIHIPFINSMMIL